jgi:hypothetical protein
VIVRRRCPQGRKRIRSRLKTAATVSEQYHHAVAVVTGEDEVGLGVAVYIADSDEMRRASPGKGMRAGTEASSSVAHQDVDVVATDVGRQDVKGPVAIQVTHRDIRRAGSDGKR